VSWPEPQPGLVIHYSYLWHREAQQGREEGQKDRPCAVVVALSDKDGSTRVYALAITHSAPTEGQGAIEIPLPVKIRLGLDAERS
jgi:hypothetical protein